MKEGIVIRSESAADVYAIRDVTAAAFKTLAISRHTEQFIIAALRAANSLTISLVAEIDGRIVGHIVFSPVTLSDGTSDWYGQGPVSVLPAFQRQGIGKALIAEGLSRLKSLHARGVCLVGHPDYYRKFGFRNAPELCLMTCRRRPSSSSLSMGIFRRERSRSMRRSKRMAKSLQPMANRRC